MNFKKTVYNLMILCSCIAILLCGCSSSRVNNTTTQAPVTAITSTTKPSTTVAEITEKTTEPQTKAITEPITKSAEDTFKWSEKIPDGSSFKIVFIDVGLGDSILAMCDGQTMLIDGGESTRAASVKAVLDKYGIKKIDVLVITHGHSDHVGGLVSIVNTFKIGDVYSSRQSFGTLQFAAIKTALDKQEKIITVTAPGDKFLFGCAKVEVFGPLKEYSNDNNNSLVLKITYGKTSFLMSGDMEKEAEKDLFGSDYDIESTVLKLGHHGNSTSTTSEFLEKVNPDYAVASVGFNVFGVPNASVIKSLSDAGVVFYRTDIHGNITCTSNGSNVTFATEKIEKKKTEVSTTIPADTKEPLEEKKNFVVVNKITRVVHRPTCPMLPIKRYRIDFNTVKDAQKRGYNTYCPVCNP